MKENRCPANCRCNSGRREFLKKSAILISGTLLVNFEAETA